jgi:hypothetical protein
VSCISRRTIPGSCVRVLLRVALRSRCRFSISLVVFPSAGRRSPVEDDGTDRGASLFQALTASANLALLRELVEAVAAGRYEQNIETFKRDRVRVAGRFQLQGREETYENSTTASAAVKPGESYVLRFEPY